MDILYLLEGGSHYHDDELRYSLRSIAKYGKNVGRIFIAGGHMPEWIDQTKVTWVKCTQPYSRKHKNMLWKIVYTCQHTDISEDFLISSDDHFYMKDVDFDNYPYFIKNKELPGDSIGGGYRLALYETRKLLAGNCLGIANYAQHCNTHFVKSVLLDNLELIKQSYDTVKGAEPTCLMLNLLQEYRPFTAISRSDVKVDDDSIHSPVLASADVISTSSKNCQEILNYIATRFPDPSPYEKTYSCVVAIPIYKKEFNESEQLSIDRCAKVLGSWPLTFFAPDNLNLSYYRERYPSVKVMTFPSQYFQSIQDYSRLLKTTSFYDAYADYDYMLIHQPDCWVFADRLQNFASMGFDYIGAPWKPQKGREFSMGQVGNGGFCLRSIKKCRDICANDPDDTGYAEDAYFCCRHKNDMRIADFTTAAHFSLEMHAEKFYIEAGCVLPMGCHKPNKYGKGFWRDKNVPLADTTVDNKAIELKRKDGSDVIEPQFEEPNPKLCVVVIPIYKERFEGNEVVSIDQGVRVLQRWPITFFAPESLNTSYYEERYPTATIVRFPDHFFKTIKDYSRLCYSSTFYEAYREYDYMQIYQPDCWIFRDEIQKYCQMGYDYIGAPWPPMPGIPCDGVGNGGFCIRRISKFIELCHKINDTGRHPEDRFWCLDQRKYLKLAPIAVAADYSLEHSPKYFNDKYGHITIPMGCHKPWRFEYSSFWRVRGVPEYVF